MNENKKAIKGVFGNKKKFKQLAIDVLNDLKIDIDEDATFREFMSQFSKDFDRFASERALKALGVDLECFDIRYCGLVDSDVVQEHIEKTTYRKLDEDIFKLFEFIDAGDVQKSLSHVRTYFCQPKN